MDTYWRFWAAIVLLAWGTSLGTAQPYKDTDGPFEVKTVSVTLQDNQRKKLLPVTIYVPQGAQAFPVIIFSHGAGGAGNLDFPLLRFWATHGYIVICPTHEDSLLLRRQTEKASSLQGVVREALSRWQLWESRALDIRFLLDQLNTLAQQVPELSNRMDKNSIGMSGHSLGAYTAQLIGGVTVDLPNGRKGVSYADPRPKAFLLFSPQGRGQQGLSEASWRNFTRPYMGVTGSLDRGAQGQPPEWRKDPFDLSPPGDKFHVFLQGARHGSFLGRQPQLFRNLSVVANRQEQIFRWVKRITLAFWDAYLKGSREALEFLRSEAIEQESQGLVQVFRK